MSLSARGLLSSLAEVPPSAAAASSSSGRSKYSSSEEMQEKNSVVLLVVVMVVLEAPPFNVSSSSSSSPSSERSLNASSTSEKVTVRRADLRRPFLPPRLAVPPSWRCVSLSSLTASRRSLTVTCREVSSRVMEAEESCEVRVATRRDRRCARKTPPAPTRHPAPSAAR